MESYIALLRGINVSGKNMIKMADLAAALSETGLGNIRTYIQSGNILFESENRDSGMLSALIWAKIKERFGFIVPVQVLSRNELNRIRDNNPYLNLRSLPEDKLHLTLLQAVPDPALTAKIAASDFSPDEFVVSGNAIYLYCPDGYGRTRLTNNFFENKLKVSATTRNWATVGKLCTL